MNKGWIAYWQREDGSYGYKEIGSGKAAIKRITKIPFNQLEIGRFGFGISFKGNKTEAIKWAEQNA